MPPGRLVAARPVFIGTRERTYLLIAFIRTVMSVLLGPGTLYRCLKDLTSAGLVERVAPPDSDNPHRKYYGLTLKGAGELANAVQELSRVTATAESRLRRLVPKEA